MRKFITTALAALTFAGGIMAATDADARDYRHRGYYDGRYYNGYYDRRHHHRHNDNDAAIVAGVAGLAIGAALASSNRRDRYYDDGYYRRGYYAPRSYYGPRGYYGGSYRRCRTVTIYDPYYDEYTRRTRCR